MGGGGGGNGVKTEACNFIENSVSDGQTVETFECWCDVNMWRCTDYQTGCTLHNFGLEKRSLHRSLHRKHF